LREDETALIRLLAEFPRRTKLAGERYEPFLICSLLIDACSTFNRLWQKERIITEDEGSTSARMLLVRAIQITVKGGLSLLGVKAPERM